MAKDKLKKLLVRIDTFKSDLESLHREIQAAVDEDEAGSKENSQSQGEMRARKISI